MTSRWALPTIATLLQPSSLSTRLGVRHGAGCDPRRDAHRRDRAASRVRHCRVSFDNRGHGMSDKPLNPDAYAEGRLWADDLAVVIETTRLERPVLVASSYGGYIVTDYLRAYGQADIAGINLVGGAVLLRAPNFDHIGAG